MARIKEKPLAEHSHLSHIKGIRIVESLGIGAMGLFSSKNKSDASSAEQEGTTQDPTSETTAPPTQQTAAMPPLSSNAGDSTDSEQPDLSPEEARKHAAVGKQLAGAFGELVTLLMRSEADRKRPIADLEWMVAPAIATGQFAIADAQSKKTGAISPVGAVLWAMVSEDVDKRLSDTSVEQAQLKPNDWRSGSEPWIVMALGDKRIVAGLIKKLSQDVFKGNAPKIRSRNTDGKIVVGRVKASEQSNLAS